MKKLENRAQNAIRAKLKALRCAETRPESPTQQVINQSEGERAQREAEEMMKPVGQIVLEAGEALHVDARELEYNPTFQRLRNTLEKPNMISVTASEERMEAALNAGVLEL